MQHDYEKTQNFNVLTQLLHGTRYRNLQKFVRRVEGAFKGETVRLVDVGCGLAKVFGILDPVHPIEYLGIELRDDFCELAERRYGERGNFRIICDSIENHLDAFQDADAVVGLESFEHIPERIVVRVVEALRDHGVPHFYCTVPNEVGPAILIKNVGSAVMGYTRHREYTWRETLAASVYDLDKVGLHDTGHKGFDWRWLAQTIRQNIRIDEITTSPVSLVPRSISPSIGFVCSRREASKT